MLTPAQKSLHWKRWSACVHANDWRDIKGRIDPLSSKTAGRTIYHRLVWRDAARLALQEHRGITAGDLRHASYLIATTNVPGWPRNARPVRTMKDLGNRTFSRTLTLWELLIDEDNIAAQIRWEHPDQSERETLLCSLENRAPDAVIGAIAANLCGTRQWKTIESLDTLRFLLRTICEKQGTWNTPSTV